LPGASKLPNTFLEEVSLTTVTSFFVAIAAIITAVIGWKKSRTEANSARADAIKVYEEAASLSAKRNQELQDRVDKLEIKIDELTAINKKKDERIVELENQTRAQELEVCKLRAEVADLRSKLAAYDTKV
jgi:TolA-binding protein